MDVTSIGNSLQKIRGSLVFFCVLLLLLACLDSEKAIVPTIAYENYKAVQISFESEGSLNEFSVHLLNQKDIPILGNFSEKGSHVLFTPVVPLSNGQEYVIAQKGKQITSFRVDVNFADGAPELLVIHPKSDTVPQNILKMYFEFSKPMQHVGNPLDFITVFDKMDNTEILPFLDLEAELWNDNHTILTLWFDPGRIKTDLIPNKVKGLPLKQNYSYTINIDKSWNSADGIPLAESYSKTIHVVGKDTKSPDPMNWIIDVPKRGTKGPLKINFDENLDPILALESIKLLIEDIELSGSLKLSSSGNGILFSPNDFWKAGNYQILINPILEDLAGNNLKDLFDSDIRIPIQKKKIVDMLEFNIK